MNKIIIEFKKIAKMRWTYLENGDSKNANLCFDKLSTLTMELKCQNELMELDSLLDDSDAGVRYEAASKLLVLNDSRAFQILKDLSMKKGILPFAARQTLKQWNNYTNERMSDI